MYRIITLEKRIILSLALAAAMLSCEKDPDINKDKEYEFVDLGLSVKWATCNVSATKPEFYQWAGLDDVTDKSLNIFGNNCPYHTGYISSSDWTKYNLYPSQGTVDGKTVLDRDDDAAHVFHGLNWRMPTDAEWRELRERCTWVWTSDYRGTGVAGMIVTSDIVSYTDRSIFLPAAGYRSLDKHYSAGDSGYYWSSSLYVNEGISHLAHYMSFASNAVGWSKNERFKGLSVRPVTIK